MRLQILKGWYSRNFQSPTTLLKDVHSLSNLGGGGQQEQELNLQGLSEVKVWVQRKWYR